MRLMAAGILLSIIAVEAGAAPDQKPLDKLKEMAQLVPGHCKALEAETKGWAAAIPASRLARAQELMVVCKALPEEPTQDVIETIGAAIFQYKPTAEPLAEIVLGSECIKQCSEIAKGLINSAQAKTYKKEILAYLVKPKLPTLATSLHQYEVMKLGATKGLWKLSKEDEAALEKTNEERKKAVTEFAPLKDGPGKLGPTQHPKYLEEIKASIGFLEAQMPIAKKLK